VLSLLKKHALNLKSIFFVGFAFSVFVYWKRGSVPYEIPKVWFIQRWVEVMLVWALFNLTHVRRVKIDKTLVVIVVTFGIWALYSALTGGNLVKSILGNYYRGDGLINLAHLLILFFIVALFFKRNWVGDFFKVASFGAFLLGAVSFVLWLMHSLGVKGITVWEGGIGGPFGNPNFLAGYLLVTLPFTAYLIDKTKNNRWWIVLVSQVVGIILTRAWIGIFGVVFLAVIWVLLKKPKLRVVTLASGFGLLLLLGIYYQRTGRKFTPTSQIVADSRERIWIKGFLGFAKRPLKGYGWANFDRAFESVDWPIHLNNDVYVDKAHSSILEVLVTTGLVGFALYTALVTRAFWLLFRQRSVFSKYLLAVFVIVVAHMQTNVVSISEEIIFWIILALSATAEYAKRDIQ
jgi:O-antigen ligase